MILKMSQIYKQTMIKKHLPLLSAIIFLFIILIFVFIAKKNQDLKHNIQDSNLLNSHNEEFNDPKNLLSELNNQKELLVFNGFVFTGSQLYGKNHTCPEELYLYVDNFDDLDFFGKTYSLKSLDEADSTSSYQNDLAIGKKVSILGRYKEIDSACESQSCDCDQSIIVQDLQITNPLNYSQKMVSMEGIIECVPVVDIFDGFTSCQYSFQNKTKQRYYFQGVGNLVQDKNINDKVRILGIIESIPEKDKINGFLGSIRPIILEDID